MYLVFVHFGIHLTFIQATFIRILLTLYFIYSGISLAIDITNYDGTLMFFLGRRFALRRRFPYFYYFGFVLGN